MRQHRPDVFDLMKALLVPVFQFPQILDFGGQQFACLDAEVVNAEAVQQAVQRILPGFFDGFAEIARRLLAESFELCDGLIIKAVDVGYAVQPTEAVETINLAFAESVNVHRVFGNVVNHALEELGFAIGIFAAPGSLVFGAHELALAHRAVGRKGDFLLRAVAQFFHRLHDVGNYVAGPLYQHRIAEAEVFVANKILIVQAHGRDGDACQRYGIELGYRRDATHFAHLKFYVEEFGGGLFGLEFEGNGPARMVRRTACPLLQIELVGLHHHAVNFVSVLFAAVLPVVAKHSYFSYVGAHFSLAGLVAGAVARYFETQFT